MKIKLAYGHDPLEITLPDERVVKCLKFRELPTLQSPEDAMDELLRRPIDSPPLLELAADKHSACVVISDVTRPVPNTTILPPILRTLEQAGISRENVLILIATGLHRSSTPAERLEMCGEKIVANYRIEDHHASRQDEHAYLGDSPRNLPVWIDTRYLNADLKIVTGLIESHFMAGYSGGRKGICPGICGAETIGQWHRPRFLEHANAKTGQLSENPVHEEGTWIAKKAGVDFLVNAVMNAERKIVGLVAGNLETAYERGVEIARNLIVDTLPEPADIIVTSGGGYPLDQTFYQTIKGIVTAIDILKEGGTVIIAGSCAEGIGCPQFEEIAAKFPTIEAFTQAILNEDFFVVNQWQIEELAKVLRKGRVVVVTDSLPPETLRRMYVETAPTVETAVNDALTRYGAAAKIAVIPDGPYVLAQMEK
ncbi:MAG: nickel-dependent lactate racemase [Planctomycetaceae bacterium]|jgi:nickel-dependent lactate racemase|nr:nickel-dependent lactate racemase [Planctomycetaceae bacterium]